MADLVEYIVAREHQGDRLTDEGTEVHLFAEGDTRTADPSVVAHLVELGVLVSPAPKASGKRAEVGASETKVEPATETKPDKPAEDKSEGGATETKVEPETENKGSAPKTDAAHKTRAAATSSEEKADKSAKTKAE